jgi:hypothetical protein
MVFPGVLRGRPGPRLATIHTSQPRRSLSSPWMFTCCSVASVHAMPPRARGHRRFGEHHRRPGDPFPAAPATSWPAAGRQSRNKLLPGSRAQRLTKSTRSRAALRTSRRPARKPSDDWWRGLTPRWPRSLRLGVRVFIQRTPLAGPRQECFRALSAHSEKRCLPAPRRLIRRRLEGLRQWMDGWRATPGK